MGQRVEVPSAGVLEFPDGMTDQQMAAAIQKNFPQLHQAPQQPAPATLGQKVQSSMPMRVLQGIRDPIDAGAQIAPRVGAFLSSAGGLYENPVSKFFNSEASRVDQMVTQGEKDYQSARQATGAKPDDFDGARLVGNVVSPANAAGGRLIGVPAQGAGMLAKAVRGGVGGAIGGAMTPVVDTDNFAAQKMAQVLGGAAGGAVFAPIASKVAEYATPVIKSVVNRLGGAENLARRSAAETDAAVTKAMEELNLTSKDVPPKLQEELRGQVLAALKSGKKLDVGAAMRQADFDALGIQPTQGQISRDATQFAKERNMRGVMGVGEPLQQRFDAQNAALQSAVGKPANGAASEFKAGEQLIQALKSADKSLQGSVSAAYKSARESSGKEMEIPVQGLAQDYAQILHDFADKIPAGVRNQFKDLGLESGKQLKLFTPEEADRIIKVINSNSSIDPGTTNALSALRGAVKKAFLDAPATDVFEPARKMAAGRFALHDAVPALEAAAKGQIAPDDFVNRYLINGKTNDVRELAKVLSQDQSALGQARSQIADYLKRSAFGENVSGDKNFTPERFAKALRELGDDKLGAFFKPEEIQKLKQVMRVGSYINQKPGDAPVSSSNSQALLASMLLRVPGIGDIGRAGVALGGAAKRAVQNSTAVDAALNAKAPQMGADVSPETMRRLAQLLSAGAPAVGSLAAIR